MGVFLDLQTELEAAMRERGVSSRAVWVWDAQGWTPEAPNTGRRWRCVAGYCEGRGDTGEEAMRALIAALREK